MDVEPPLAKRDDFDCDGKLRQRSASELDEWSRIESPIFLVVSRSPPCLLTFIIQNEYLKYNIRVLVYYSFANQIANETCASVCFSVSIYDEEVL